MLVKKNFLWWTDSYVGVAFEEFLDAVVDVLWDVFVEGENRVGESGVASFEAAIVEVDDAW